MEKNKLLELYDFAAHQGHAIYWYSIHVSEVHGISIPLSNGTCAIAMDPWKIKTIADEYCDLAHEIGHCERGAFYNRYATCDIIKKHENQADRWAIENTISSADLDAAIADGYGSIFELADYFNVTEDFMRKAVCLYTFGNLDCKDYLPM